MDDNDRDGSNTLINALIGAVVAVVLSAVPLSTLLGGMVAGYLEDGDADQSLRVGAFAGLLMLVPGVLFLLLLSSMIAVVAIPIPTGGSIVVAIVLVLGVAYTVGLAAAGGYLSVYLRREL